MKKILLILAILLVQTLYAFGIQIGPITYSILSQEDLTVGVVSVDKNYDESTLSIPAQIQYNEQNYSVTTIGKSAFSHSQFIESIELPEGLKEIEDNAFSWCEKLKHVTFPSTLEEIGKSAFTYCTSLEEITLPNSVYKIGIAAFSVCKALKYVSLPNSIEILEMSIFDNCHSLETIEIPASVKELDFWSFAFCERLTTVFIPLSVEKITAPFCGCPNLLSIIIDEDNPYFCAENGIIYNKDKTTLVEYPSATEEVEVSDGVIEIGDYAFQESKNLTSILLPATIEKIGDCAFYDCHELQKVIVFATTPPELASSAFTAECDPLPNPDIFVPAESLELYKSAPRWSSRKNKIFSIDGTSDIRDLTDDNNSIYEVFSIQGLHILTTTNKDDLQNMTTGLYIINGKKIFLNN